MKVYVDTNIIVADALKQHAHHQNAVELFRRIKTHRWTPVVAAHGLVEAYSVLTRIPYSPRFSPAEVWQLLQENVFKQFEIQGLTGDEYARLVRNSATRGWTGGLIYDAVHLAVARKVQCGRIYTLNVRHFRQLAPDLHDRIMAP